MAHRSLGSAAGGHLGLGLGKEGPGRPGRSRCAGGRQAAPPVRAAAGPQLSGAVEVINNLGMDTLTFLVATVLVIPAFKGIKASPILGFLLSGVVLSQFGLIRNVTDVKALSELGILFLLFEMGLELSLERLKALAKFAFGMGLPQVLLSTLAFTAFELPPNRAIGTQILEVVFNARPDLVNIRSVDEAVVIGAALSLSSSAFVLQLLSERGELPTRFGSATLGILLLQDIAVVPLLVILPILETGNFTDESVFPLLLAAALKALLGLGLLLLAGRVLLRRFFEVVADSRSPEAFVALCLLTVTGTSLLTQRLGFSDSLGAFLAGALLAETNYRNQVEADIRPFRGLLLGLFFVTTGTSIDFNLLSREWQNILALLGGLIAIKTTIITALGPRVGLTLAESLRTGLLLSQGGEFAFVVFSLANQLGVLPLELNRLLIIVVVLSMVLTPALDAVGRRVAAHIDSKNDTEIPPHDILDDHVFEHQDPVVILGFGQMAQVLANFLSTPLLGDSNSGGWPYVSFDLDPGRVKHARKLGFRVLYGDGSRPAVLQTAGISRPKAVMVMYAQRSRATTAVETLRAAWPGVPIYARAQDLSHLLELKLAGATDVVLENAETSLRLGSVLLQELGVTRDDIVFMRRTMRGAMDQRARDAIVNRDGSDTAPVVELYQAKVEQTLRSRDSSNGSLYGALALVDGDIAGDDDPILPTTDFAVEEELYESDGLAQSRRPAPDPAIGQNGSRGRVFAKISRRGRSSEMQAEPVVLSDISAGSTTADVGHLTEERLEGSERRSPGASSSPSAHANDDMPRSGVEGDQGLKAASSQEQENSSPLSQHKGTSTGHVKNQRRKDNEDKRGISFCELEMEEGAATSYNRSEPDVDDGLPSLRET